MAIILGIESSCDETSAAVCIDGTICSNIIATQQVHQKYGGVIPELASRLHQQNIVPVIDEALKQAKVHKNAVSAIAYTQGPGLMGALLVGSSFAKGYALALNKPLIGINHMQAHVLAHFIDDPKPPFPFICLTVSGGHTQIVLMKDYFEMEIIGETTDDAAGEAFDKGAKMLGLPYPGGPLIDKYAKLGNPKAYVFPEPHVPGLNFSFSGVKTAFLYFLNKEKKQQADFVDQHLVDICASFQHTIVEILLNKLQKAIEQTGIQHVAIAGGVSANSGLRDALNERAQKHNWTVYIPQFAYCTDNAAMIAIAGYHKFLNQEFSTQAALAYPRL